MFQKRICRENQNTQFVFSNFFSENRAVYEITWKNMVQPDRPQTIIWRMSIACWIPQATDRHSEYVILTVFRTATMIGWTKAPQCYVIRRGGADKSLAQPGSKQATATEDFVLLET